MPKQKNLILQAQARYLETGDPAEIEVMYRNLLTLGFYILARLGRYQDEDDVKDIVTDLCMRLMEKKEPVLNGAPSAYLKMALFYKNKPRSGPADLDSLEDNESYNGGDLWEYIDRLVRKAGLTDSDTDRLVLVTMTSLTNWRSIYRNIQDPVLKKEYKTRMKEIEECVRLSANSPAAFVR